MSESQDPKNPHQAETTEEQASAQADETAVAQESKPAVAQAPTPAAGKAKSSPVKLRETPRVSLEIFEGPLDLLLYLIRKNEYDIFDIPIADITKQYLSYLDILQELNLEVAGEFLVMAATLMKIKSRMLLPQPEPDDEEEGEDPRAALVRQLIEYQKYKEAAEHFMEKEQLGRDVFARTFENPELKNAAKQESSYLEVDVYQMIEALRAVIRRLPEKSAHIIRMEPYSVKERMGQLIERFRGFTSITFFELFKDTQERIEVVTTFLALLELVRLQMMKLYQTEPNAPIRIMSLVKDEQGDGEDNEDNDGIDPEAEEEI